MPTIYALTTLTLMTATIAFLVCYIVIRSENLHRHFSHDEIKSGPQKYHAEPTPRIGGVAIAAALVGSIIAIKMFGLFKIGDINTIFMLMLAAIPAFVGGFSEDVTKRVSALTRLMLTASAGFFASMLVGATLDRVDIPILDVLLQQHIFAIALTVFAVCGVANAINIIDGYNGLVGGYALLVLAALAYVALQVDDQIVLTASLIMAAAVFGFLIWNYPQGRIFLGDGGAYLLGFWLAELSVMLVARNPDVSPWFPLSLLSYPIYEALFSIYRKQMLMGRASWRPDGLHFQMLIYKRLVRFYVFSKDSKQKTIRNSLVAPYIWIMSIIFFIPTIALWNQSGPLALVTLTFCVFYTILYWRMLKWKSPAWLMIQRR